MLRGELGPIALEFGRATIWSANSRRFRFDIVGDSYRASHPLRQPAQDLRIYERLWRSVAATLVVVRPNGNES